MGMCLHWCGQICNDSIEKYPLDVIMYSLDSHIDNFVESIGPINLLSVVAKGRNFDILSGTTYPQQPGLTVLNLNWNIMIVVCYSFFT